MRKTVRIIPAASLLVLTALLLWWLTDTPTRPPSTQPVASQPATVQVIRLGLIPERDVVLQRKRYRALADYLAPRLGCQVELATLSTYQAILDDFAEKRVDGAFLGSLIAVLTFDRLGGRVLAKPENAQGRSTYRGVLFTLDDSPIRAIDDLAGRSVSMVRTTTGGNLYPMVQFMERGMLNGARPPHLVWCGTHDEAIQAVLDRRADAGAVKDLRLDDFEKRNSIPKIRRLGHSQPVPDNALVMRADVPDELAGRIARLLLAMDQDPEGRRALQAFGAARFLPCAQEEYRAIYDMVRTIGPAWNRLGIAGPPPATMPSTAPASRPQR